jgi:hypothetical protein
MSKGVLIVPGHRLALNTSGSPRALSDSRKRTWVSLRGLVPSLGGADHLHEQIWEYRLPLSPCSFPCGLVTPSQFVHYHQVRRNVSWRSFVCWISRTYCMKYYWSGCPSCFVVAVTSPAVSRFVDSVVKPQIQDIKAAGTYKSERVIQTKQAVEVEVAGVKRKLLNFCANNYLGLSVIIGLTIRTSCALAVRCDQVSVVFVVTESPGSDRRWQEGARWLWSWP